MSGDDSGRRSVLIVGAGLGGMQAALLLADVGVTAFLLEQGAGTGGSLHLLDRTYPTDSCGLCAISPHLPAYCPTLECVLRENIVHLPYSALVRVEGEAGDFRVTIRHKPRFVVAERCTGCGLCAELCPADRPSPYVGCLHREKAIYRPESRAVPQIFLIDMDFCTRCGRCVQVCPHQAVDLAMKPSYSRIEVGAILLAPGCVPFDARERGEYGYGRYPNVLTGLEFERMLALSGFTGGQVLRPSDGRKPGNIAFLQCVGSRDRAPGTGYCSSVCCMYTDKQAAWVVEREPGVEATVFRLDTRACGKGFEQYHHKVAALPSVRYVPSMVSAVKEVPGTRNLVIRYIDEGGRLREEEFGLVVLAVGLRPSAGLEAATARLGLDLDEYGFVPTSELSLVESSCPGVFVAGAAREPADIPRTLVEASAAAASVLKLLGQGDVQGAAQPAAATRDTLEEEPRIGVFLCSCEGEVGDVVVLEEVSSSLRRLEGTVHLEILPLACGYGGSSCIARRIGELSLNRLVVAGCSDRLLRKELQGAMESAGLDGRLLETVNIREQCAWVHQAEPRLATAKALNLVEIALAKVWYNGARTRASYPIAQSALVVGGGLAGLSATLELAELGYPVYLVEQDAELGGNLRRIAYTLEGNDPAQHLGHLIDRVRDHPLVSIYQEAEVNSSCRLAGRYATSLTFADGSTRVIEHGATIVATGGREAETVEHLYAQDHRVLTQRELEAKLAQDPESLLSIDSVVMIQCVGSREAEKPYCSQVCCPQAVKNALKIAELRPEINIFILHRDMRTPGLLERYYESARAEGVIFTRYRPERKPKVRAEGDRLKVSVFDLILGEELELEADLLVLSVGVEPNDVRHLAKVFDLPLDEDGFFQEHDIKARPLSFFRPGFYLAGLARFPCSIGEAIAQGRGAAMHAVAFLAQGALEARGTVASVNPRRCGGCGVCIEACSYGARALDPETLIAEVLEYACVGCGACVPACPNGATEQYSFERAGMLAMIDEASG